MKEQVWFSRRDRKRPNSRERIVKKDNQTGLQAKDQHLRAEKAKGNEEVWMCGSYSSVVSNLNNHNVSKTKFFSRLNFLQILNSRNWIRRRESDENIQHWESPILKCVLRLCKILWMTKTWYTMPVKMWNKSTRSLIYLFLSKDPFKGSMRFRKYFPCDYFMIYSFVSSHGLSNTQDRRIRTLKISHICQLKCTYIYIEIHLLCYSHPTCPIFSYL